MKGLFSWIGFKQAAVVYDRAPRFAGKTKWNYWRLWNFALEGITSVTADPLKLATYFGLVTALGAFLYAIFIVARTSTLGIELPGYASLMAVILFSAGAQLTAIGIIGEYIGRIFVECKGRPLYVIDKYMPAASNATEPSMEVSTPRSKDVAERLGTHTIGTPDKAARNMGSPQSPGTKVG